MDSPMGKAGNVCDSLREWLIRDGNTHGFNTAQEKIAQAIRDAILEEREQNATIADREVDLYAAHREDCDATGNTFGGTMGTVGELACQRIAAAIRARSP